VQSTHKQKNEGVCSSDDPNVNVKLSNKYEVLTVSEPQGLVHLKKKGGAKPIVNSKNNEKCRKVLLLGSNCRGLRERLHSIPGDEYMVTNKKFKPSATLGNVVGELKALSKHLTNDDHVIIVGGPGNSLDRDLNYKIENDMDDIAKNSIHTNVGFVGRLDRRERLHMSKWVRSANMRLQRALWVTY
jgi:hypothetical protein